MSRTIALTTFAMVFAACGTLRAAQEVDVNLAVAVGGQLYTLGGYYTSGSYAGRVFDGSFGLTGLTTTNPGFYAPATTFPNYSPTPPFVGLRLDFVRELLFWNGTQLAAPNVRLTVQSGTRTSMISGTDTAGKPGILIGNIPSDRGYHVHANYVLQSGAATGLYGIVVTLGPQGNGANAGFTTSEPVLIALARGNVQNIDGGMAALANAALVTVPEPTAAALGVVGLVAVFGLGSFRRRRTPTALRAMVVVATGMLLASAPAQAGLWTLGHGDIGVAYHPAESTGEFEMELHVGSGAVVSGSTVTAVDGIAFAPGDIAIGVPATANLKAIRSGSTAVWGGDAAGYDFVATGTTLGVAEGSDLWVLSFAEFDADYYHTPFLGWATEEGFAGESFGDVTFRPVSFSGPTGGSMGVFSDSLTPLWVLLAGDGTFTDDAFTAPADSHAHKVLAFTQPGTYSIGIEASAFHPTHGLVTGQAVYTFEIVPEPSGWLLAASAAAGFFTIRGLRRRDGWCRRASASTLNSWGSASRLPPTGDSIPCGRCSARLVSSAHPRAWR